MRFRFQPPAPMSKQPGQQLPVSQPINVTTAANTTTSKPLKKAQPYPFWVGGNIHPVHILRLLNSHPTYERAKASQQL
jgi:hypothetical protein